MKVETIKLSKKKTTKGLVVSFSGALQQGAAQNVGDYQLFELAKSKKAGLHATKAVVAEVGRVQREYEHRDADARGHAAEPVTPVDDHRRGDS